MSDYYKVLEVDQNASIEDIKKNYKQLAKKYHPSGSNPDSEKFKALSQAYSVLSDEQKRKEYDMQSRFGHSAGGYSTGGGFQDLGDIFGSFFGGGTTQQQDERGSDLQVSVTITLEEAATGCTKSIPITKTNACSTCNGSGSKTGKTVTCNTCKGRGYTVQQVAIFQQQITCRACHGTGQQIVDPCGTCSGSGTKRDRSNIECTIPAGIKDGQQIRLRGQGAYGKRGSGDLYIQVQIKPHDIFTRQNGDLFIELTIDLQTAILGGNVQVPLLTGGSTTISVPAGAQHGTKLRIKGKGLTSSDNLYCIITIEIPKVKNPTDWAQFFDQQKQNIITNKRDSWLERLKRYFAQ